MAHGRSLKRGILIARANLVVAKWLTSVYITVFKLYSGLLLLYTEQCTVYQMAKYTICQEQDKCLILKRREELQLYYVYIKWKGRRQEIIRLLIILSSKYALQSAYICTELYRLCVYFPISLRGLKLLQGKSNKIFELLLIN